MLDWMTQDPTLSEFLSQLCNCCVEGGSHTQLFTPRSIISVTKKITFLPLTVGTLYLSFCYPHHHHQTSQLITRYSVITMALGIFKRRLLAIIN